MGWTRYRSPFIAALCIKDMKLLREFTYLTDAESLSSRFRNKGIMTFISSKESINIPMSHGGASKVGVWVVFPNQYDDAFILLNNKKHNVSCPLSIEEMDEIDKQNNLKYSQNFNKFIAYSFGFLIVLIIGFIIYGTLQNA